MKGLTEEALQRIAWDYRPLEWQAPELLIEEGLTQKKIEIYRKLLMSVRWYELIDMLTAEQISEALSPEVIKTLWPAGVKKTFSYAARLLPQSTLSTTG